MIKKFLKKLYSRFYLRVFPLYSMELEKAVGDCKSLLDIGCGSESPIKPFSKKLYCVGIDSFVPSIQKSKKRFIHNKYYQMNVLDIGKKFKPNSFDCVLASDLIEHLNKEEGLKLIEVMEKLAKKRVIIYTPNGFLPQGEFDNNLLQKHKSGWSVEEMKKKGYNVLGVNGLKCLRKEYSLLKFSPMYFWLIVSDITQLFVRKNPKMAFQILCIKEKKF